MQKLKFKDKEYNIPTHWNDLTLRQYLKFVEFVRLSNIDENSNMEPLFFYSRVFKTFTDENINFYDIPYIEYTAFRNAISFIYTEIPVNKTKAVIQTRNTIVEQKNLEELTFGEYVDINAFASKQTIDNQLKVIAAIVDVYEKPDWKKLRFKRRLKNMTLDEKTEYIANLPAADMNNIYAFFLHGQKKFMRNLLLSLNKQVLLVSIKILLRLPGVFISGSWKLVKKTLRKWMRLSTNPSDKY